MGTAVGQDSVALFQNGPAAIERKTGEYVWSYRITRIDHGRVGLINEHGAEHWVLPGQTVEGTAAVVPGGAVSGSPTAAIGSPAAAAPEAARSRSAGGILVGPRTTAQLSVGDSPLPLVRKAD
jgi:hypothetical protein